MEKGKKQGIVEKIELPEGVKCELIGGVVKLEGPKGCVIRELNEPRISITKEGNNILISSKKQAKREKKIIGTFRAHIKNMIKGALKGHVYQLKICASHFPMNVSMSGRDFILKNFLGEKVPRKFKIPEGVDIKIEGDLITVGSINKELASQAAASIERLTRVRNKDLRIFQDGIYIISKDGMEIK